MLFPVFHGFWAVFSSGIESMRAGHCRAAFTCFKLAADRGYSKAQFNVGLCYEHGRGTEKDLEKVPRVRGVGMGSAHQQRDLCWVLGALLLLRGWESRGIS